MSELYMGHPSQVYGVEEHRLIGGKGDGMRLFQVRNGSGLEFTVSADRCADISRLSFKGDNFGYFSPCGYVGPEYYDNKGDGFLKSFTAGFLTTCGLTAVGLPCRDDGEDLPLHGNISNTPAESIYAITEENQISIHASMRSAAVFYHKLILDRTISCPVAKNSIKITDRITNLDAKTTPFMFLYHLNIGYPLLHEELKMHIPSHSVKPRNGRAAKDIDNWNKIIPPQPRFEEQCYYHSFTNEGLAAIFNPVIGKGLAIQFDAKLLDHFVQWKMMGVRDYVLGLEPANCHTDGRNVMREQGHLKFIQPDETITYSITLEILENETQWGAIADA